MIMNKFYALVLVLIFSCSAFSQDESSLKNDSISNWKLKSIFSLNITQSSFTNWASGGRNNISGLGFINASAEYSKNRLKWSNQLSFGLGGVQYFDDVLQKTDDVIDAQSTLSYGMRDPFYLSLLGGFRTQFIDGFANPQDSIRSSTFMAPGYVNLTLGVEYIPNEHFKIMLSPLSGKFTFVQDPLLASVGAFGVEPGENFRAELGSYLRVIYNKELMEDIDLRSRIEFFSNYLNNPQNIDINSEVILDFKVNKWFSASLQMNLIYDDDIDIEDRNGNVGPRTQFKQVIGLGITYRLANFKPEKK
jgi:hypothetical protein